MSLTQAQIERANKINAQVSWLKDWGDRVSAKTGLCHAALCESVAEYCGESGNEGPSLDLIETARLWENNPEQIFEYIEESGKWCKRPTSGCLRYCNMWRSGCFAERKVQNDTRTEP